MAQRRSRNRRISLRRLSNVSGFLDENTNVFENNDPLWFDRTILRPSTSLVLSKNDSSILNPDSTINASQLSDKWFNNLTRSDSSKVIEENVKKNIENHLIDEQNKTSHIDPSTESESEHESQRRHAKFRFNRTKNNKSDQSNAFLKALEKTTDSQTKNLTNIQLPEENESELSNDTTTKKIRPMIFRNKKQFKEHASNFDDVFHTDSTVENVPENLGSSKSIKRKSKDNIHSSIDDIAQKLRKNNAQEELVNNTTSLHEQINKENNKTKNKTENETSRRKSRKRSMETSKTRTPIKISQNISNKQPVVNDSMNISNSILETAQKKRTALFSQEQNKKADKNLFDAVFETDEENSTKNTENELAANKTLEFLRSACDTNQENNYLNHEKDDDVNLSTSKNLQQTISDSRLIERNVENLSRNNNRLEISNTTGTQKAKNGQNKSPESLIKNTSQYKKDTSIYLSNSQNISINNESNLFEANGKSNSSENDDSDSSSIPKNIRRTRSRSIFSQPISKNQPENEDTFDNNNESELQNKKRKENLSQKELTNYSLNQSKNKSKRFPQSKNTSINNLLKIKENNFINMGNEERDESSSSDSEIFQPSISESTILDLDEEHITNDSFNRSEKLKASTKSRHKYINNQKSKSSSSQNLIKSLNDTHSEESELESDKDNLSSSQVNHKKRSHFLTKKKASKNQNISEKKVNASNSLSVEKCESTNIESNRRLSRKTKLSESLNDSKSRSINNRKLITKSINNSLNVSLTNKSLLNANTGNESQKNQNDSENSSIPKQIRRTRSRLFQRSDNDNDVFDKVLDTANSTTNEPSQNNENKNTRISINQKAKRSSTLDKFLNQNNNSISRDSVEKALYQEALTPRIVLQRISTKGTSNNSSLDNQQKIQNNDQDQISEIQKSKISPKTNDLMNESRKSNMKDTTSERNKNNTTLAEIHNTTVGSVNNSSKISNVERRALEEKSDESSVETSSDGTPPEIRENQSLHQTIAKSVNSEDDDLLRTPNPAQSTLNPSGKPVTRITQFSFRNDVTINSISSSASVSKKNPKSRETTNIMRVPVQEEKGEEEKGKENEEEEENNVDEVNSSEVSDYPLLTRQLNDIPYDAEKSTYEERASPFLDNEVFSSTNQINNNITTIEDAVWKKVKEKTDALKREIIKRAKQEEEVQKERERQKARSDAILKRLIAQQEAEKKRKQKKTIDKAFYVDGKIYKQPKLPRPKNWVTDKLYKHLWKCMEPKFRLETRIKSEEFIRKLSDIFNVITKRKKYDNYKAELDDLLVTMAKLNIIKDRYDFNRFCGEFMPYKFRVKVRPMQMPGNVRNIPYDPKLITKPILDESHESSDSDNDSNNNNN